MELTATASNAAAEPSGTPEEPRAETYAVQQNEPGISETPEPAAVYVSMTATPSNAIPASPETMPMLYEILFVILFILFYLAGILLEKILLRKM